MKFKLIESNSQNNMAKFLKNHKYDLLSNNLDKIYDDFDKKYRGEASELTQFLLSANIDPLNYLTKIHRYAFKYLDIKQLKLPNNIKSIGDGAFYECLSLQSITIPNSVTDIGDNAFDGCESLKSITIPNSVTQIGYSVFNRCKSLKSMTIPNSVTKIDDYAFASCKSLKSINIPNSVTEIGEYAFYECDSLKQITLPEKFEYELYNIGIDSSQTEVIFT